VTPASINSLEFSRHRLGHRKMDLLAQPDGPRDDHVGDGVSGENPGRAGLSQADARAPARLARQLRDRSDCDNGIALLVPGRPDGLSRFLRSGRLSGSPGRAADHGPRQGRRSSGHRCHGGTGGSSAFLSPALLGLFATWMVPDGDLHVDYLEIGKTLLITQMLPLALGPAPLGRGVFRSQFRSRHRRGDYRIHPDAGCKPE
jgi:hypothetical protein